MSGRKAGYYSVIQYCPDRSRLEACNVGVVLLIDGKYLGCKISNNSKRVHRFFARPDFSWIGDKSLNDAIEAEWQHVTCAKISVFNRLETERDKLMHVDALKDYIRTRANDILLTDLRTCIVGSNPESDLGELFQELVGES